MSKSQIRRYIGSFIIIALAITVISFYAGSLFKKDAYNRTIEILKRSNTLTWNILSLDNFLNMDDFIKSIAVSDIRVTIIRANGKVVADSQADISRLDNHASRPEINEAINGVSGYSKRYSDSLGEDLVYVAMPMRKISGKSYIIRSAMSVKEIDSTLGDIINRILYTGFITFLALSILSFLSERRLISPLSDIQKAAESYSTGNLDHHLTVQGPEDMRIVAESINSMAESLKFRLNEITRSKNQLDAVFSSMMEAVVVLDESLNIRHLNQSALKILDLSGSEVIGKSLIEVFMNSALQSIAEEVLNLQTPVERDISINSNRNLVLKVHGTQIPHENEKTAANAIVLVLNDITKTHHLESMRRDFVANVSHELKTPITNVKGYLETLLESDMADTETTEHFLNISLRNANRLNAILDDLLSLSRLEHQDNESLEVEIRSIEGVITAAFQSCAPKATEKEVKLILEGERNLLVPVNTLLMEQALTNLIDNAVKYSSAGSSVRVEIQKKDNQAVISVSDEGIGIPSKDLPRVFERFYRVDKARSRELGGTGLGLAIVKHIAIVHNGSVKVESEPGKGAAFTIRIPLA